MVLINAQPMNRRTHKTAKHAHARQRAHEHFGMSLTKDRINNIIKQIESGKAIAIDHDIDGRSVYFVTVDQQRMQVVYQHYDKTIITVKPAVQEEWY